MATAFGVCEAELGNGSRDDETLLASKLQVFQSMIETKNRALIDELWSDKGFHLIGSERGEICLTRAQVEAKLEAIFSSPSTLVLEFPRTHISVVGNAGWIFAEGVLTRRDPAGLIVATDYLATCIFEQVEGVWRWRQFFGSEPH